MKSNLQVAWTEINEHLKAFVTKKIKNEDAAKDLVQDVFIKVQSNIHTLNDAQKIESWIFQITRNMVNDYYRNQKRAHQMLHSEEPALPTFSQNETLELSRCMRPMIDLLPAKYKEALKLSEIDGISQKDLAEQLEISYSGAKSRVQRGREKLKQMLLQCCEISTDKYGNIIEFQKKNCIKDCS